MWDTIRGAAWWPRGWSAGTLGGDSRLGRQHRSLIREREMLCGVVWCGVVWSVGAGEVGGGEVRWPVRREGTRLDQCLMSPGRCHDWHCPGWATLSALSRRHSANRRGDDTVTTQLELSTTTITITISHNMELLLRQNSFDIHNKPPAAGGLFDREYRNYSQSPSLHFSFFSRPLPGYQSSLLPRCFQYWSRYRYDLVSWRANYFNSSVFSLGFWPFLNWIWKSSRTLYFLLHFVSI